MTGSSFSCVVFFVLKPSIYEYARLALKPRDPSGPRGWRVTVIFLPKRASSSRFIALSLEIKRSGLLDELKLKMKKIVEKIRENFTFK